MTRVPRFDHDSVADDHPERGAGQALLRGLIAERAGLKNSGVPVGESLLFFGFALQRICCLLTNPLLMTWLTAHSVNAVEMASPARWRSP